MVITFNFQNLISKLYHIMLRASLIFLSFTENVMFNLYLQCTFGRTLWDQPIFCHEGHG